MGKVPIVGRLCACLVVPDDSASKGARQFVPIDADHFNVCKPKSTACDSYEYLKDLVRKVYTPQASQLWKT